jgi:hypothetical protein
VASATVVFVYIYVYAAHCTQATRRDEQCALCAVEAKYAALTHYSDRASEHVSRQPSNSCEAEASMRLAQKGQKAAIDCCSSSRLAASSLGAP